MPPVSTSCSRTGTGWDEPDELLPAGERCRAPRSRRPPGARSPRTCTDASHVQHLQRRGRRLPTPASPGCTRAVVMASSVSRLRCRHSVRDSKERAGPVLPLSVGGWRPFITGARGHARGAPPAHRRRDVRAQRSRQDAGRRRVGQPPPFGYNIVWWVCADTANKATRARLNGAHAGSARFRRTGGRGPRRAAPPGIARPRTSADAGVRAGVAHQVPGRLVATSS